MRALYLSLILVLLALPVWAKSPPPGTGAQDVPANILLMLDTSGSMDTYVSAGDSRYPVDVAFDSAGNIYISKYFDEVEKYSPTGEYILKWGGYHKKLKNGKFDYTFAIAIDSNDNIYVSDHEHGRIQKFNTDGDYLDQLDTSGGTAYGVAIDSGNNVYALDSNGRVQKFNSSGTLLQSWSNNGGRHIAIDSSDNVYVTKFNSFRIQKFDTNGNLLDEINTSYKPYGIDTDVAGNLYVTEVYDGQVHKYSPSGSHLDTWGSEGSGTGQFNSPRGVAHDTEGNIWVADFYNHRVQGLEGEELIVGGAPKTRLDVMKNVIKSIVSDSDLTDGANFGLMQWNYGAAMEVNVGYSGASQIFGMIDTLNAGGGTYLDNAMNLAESYFLGADTPMIDGATCQQNILIVISDGFWNDTTASDTAESLLANQGIKTFAVGFQTTGNNNYVTLSQKGGTYPDSPLYASNEAHMLEVLTNYIRQIISSQLTFTAPVILPGVTNDDHILQATFTYKPDHQWKGHLYKYALDNDGEVGALQWDAGAVLNQKAASSRNIWTVGNGIPAGLNNFTTDNLDRLRDPMEENSGVTYTDEELTSLVNFVRGVDSYDEYPSDVDDEGDTLLTGERWKLADVYHSKPIAVGSPSAHTSDDANNYSDAKYRFSNGYISFRNGNTCGGACASREQVIYVGANSGILHAFSSSTGEEKWAFIPPSVIPSFKDMIALEAGASNSIYGVDGSPVVKDIYYEGQWRTVLMAGLRQGGHSYFALDITDPDNPAHLFTFAYNTLNDTVSYWDAEGIRTTYASGDEIPDAFNFRSLGEAWSQPNILRLPLAEGDKWVAVLGGGYNNAINPDYGARVFVIDLEEGGIILNQLTLADSDATNNIENAVPPRVTAITADTTTSFTSAGAMLYVTDLEGKLWKINLTDAGTMYETTKLFDTEATLANDRLAFHELSASILSGGELVAYFGTANMQNLSRTDVDIANRAFALHDTAFPAFTSTTPYTVANLQNVTSGGTCPAGTQKGWYLNMDPNEKITAKLTIKNDTIFVPRYTPESAQVCQAGSAKITEHSFTCGDTVRTSLLGSGMPTEIVVYKNKVYVGVSSDSEEALPTGFNKQGNLVIGDPAVITNGVVTIESWKEEF
ncbi:MAG: VWA domain-containing protein [Rickettsiales bacterium]|nr:VWA domain-containing protein [Rickettsiales bacterium]